MTAMLLLVTAPTHAPASPHRRFAPQLLPPRNCLQGRGVPAESVRAGFKKEVPAESQQGQGSRGEELRTNSGGCGLFTVDSETQLSQVGIMALSVDDVDDASDVGDVDDAVSIRVGRFRDESGWWNAVDRVDDSCHVGNVSEFSGCDSF